MIDETPEFSINAQAPATISEAVIRLVPNSESSSNKVLEKSELLLDFKIPLPLETGCIISVQLPTEFTQLYQEVKMIKVYGMFGFIRSLPFKKLSNNIIEIQDACLSYTENYVEAKIRIKYVVNPSSVRDSSPFSIRVLNQDLEVLAQTDKNQFIVPSTEFKPADLIELRIEPSNPIVQEKSDLNLAFKTTNSLSDKASIKIEFPAEVKLSNICNAQTLTVQTIKYDFTCTVTPDSNVVFISDLFYSYGYDPLLDKLLKIDFIDLIEQNPISVTTNLNFTVTTFDQFDGKFSPVDSQILVISEFNKAGALLDLGITFDYSISNYYPAKATISFKANHQTIEDESMVEISFSRDFRLAQSELSVLEISGFSMTEPFFQLTDSQTIQVYNLGTLKNGSEVQFEISSIQLPRYQGLVNEPIHVSIKDLFANEIDSEDFQYFIDESASFSQLQMTLSSQKNRAQTEVKISFQLQVQSLLVQPGDSLKLILPEQIQVDTDILNCRLSEQARPCAYDLPEHTISVYEISTQSTELEQIGQEIYFDGLFNPLSTRPLSLFSFNLMDRDSRLIIKGDTLVWQTSEPAPLQIKLEQVSTVPLELTNYVFKPIENGSFFESTNVLMHFPECMSFSEQAKQTMKVEDFNGLSHQISFPSNNQVQITQSRSQISEIILKDIVNPTEKCLLSAESTIRVETYEDEGFKYLQSTFAVQPSLECEGTCLSCLLTNKSVCTSCIDGLFLTKDGNCLGECPLESYSEFQTASCIDCSQECSTCSGEPDFCLTCTDLSKVISDSGKCISEQLKELEELQCPSGQYLDPLQFICDECSQSCATCAGQSQICTSCKENFALDSGNCIDACEISEDENCLKTSWLEIAKAMLLDLKISYAMMFIFLILVLTKLTCKRKISLLIAMVIVASSCETIALTVLIWDILTKSELDDEMTSGESYTLKIMPSACLVIILLLNICVTCTYLRAIKKPVDEQQTTMSQDQKATIDHWKGKIFTCSRVSCLLASVLLSFHNTAWLNICGQLPLPLKRRLFMHRFVNDYARASKLSNLLPRVFLLVYGIYFGVFESFGSMQSRTIKMTIIDLALVISLHMFILLLALNFQWSSKALIQNSLDKETADQQTNGLFRAKNSIALHNLRLSDKDKAELDDIELQKLPKDDEVMKQKSQTIVIRNSAELKNFFLTEKNRASIMELKSKSVAAKRSSIEDSPLPKTIQRRQGRDSSINKELDFGFFNKVKKSIGRRKKQEEIQEANQTIKSSYRIKTKKLEEIKGTEVVSRRRSQDVLSPVRLASYHNRIDASFNQKIESFEKRFERNYDQKIEPEQLDPSLDRNPSVRDFTIESHDQQTFDASYYTSNDQFFAGPAKLIPTSNSRPASILIKSKFEVKP